MKGRQLAGTITVLALVLSVAPAAQAQRVPSTRTQNEPAHGTRPDIRVPYLTNGNSNLGVYQGVAPRIYATPIVNDATYPQVRPVYNLPFYGGVMEFGSGSNGVANRVYSYPLNPTH